MFTILPPPLFYQTSRLLATEKRTFQIDAMDEIPILFRDGQRIEARKPRRIIDQAIQTPHPIAKFLKHPLDLGHAFEIGLKQLRPATIRRRLLRLFTRSMVMNRNPETRLCQPQGDPAPNPLGRPGHQHRLRFHTGMVAPLRSGHVSH